MEILFIVVETGDHLSNYQQKTGDINDAVFTEKL